MKRIFHPDNKTVDIVYNPRLIGEVYSCEICGFDLHKKELKKQNGYLKCKECIDEPDNSKRRSK